MILFLLPFSFPFNHYNSFCVVQPKALGKNFKNAPCVYNLTLSLFIFQKNIFKIMWKTGSYAFIRSFIVWLWNMETIQIILLLMLENLSPKEGIPISPFCQPVCYLKTSILFVYGMFCLFLCIYYFERYC